jgi:hypothetical protein
MDLWSAQIVRSEWALAQQRRSQKREPWQTTGIVSRPRLSYRLLTSAGELVRQGQGRLRRRIRSVQPATPPPGDVIEPAARLV